MPTYVENRLSTVKCLEVEIGYGLVGFDVDNRNRFRREVVSARRPGSSKDAPRTNPPRVFLCSSRSTTDEDDWTRTDDDVYGASRRREKAEVVCDDDANDDDDAGDADAGDDARADECDGDGATGTRCATGRRDGADDDDARGGGQSRRG